MLEGEEALRERTPEGKVERKGETRRAGRRE